MTENHPITPPPELVQQWVSLACEYEGNETWPPPELVQQWVSFACEYEGNETWIDLATQAAHWGSDRELEVCLEWLFLNGWSAAVKSLRDARRPKPPSLKKQALTLLDKAEDSSWDINDFSIVRRALELLPND